MAPIHKSPPSIHSKRLLALDSSAHLRTYRGSLGPYRTSPITSDVPVIDATQWSPIPSTNHSISDIPVMTSTQRSIVPVRNQSVTAGHIPSNVPDLQPHDDPELIPYKPYLRTSWVCTMAQPGDKTSIKDSTSRPAPNEAPAVQAAVQVSAPSAQAIASAYNMSQPPNTIPTPLRDALNRCNAHSGCVADPATVYEVVEDTTSAHMDYGMKVVGSYGDLREANEAAVRHFVDGGFLAAGLEPPDIRIFEKTRISCGITTDESMGGYTTVYVRMVRMR
jgi:hypothetical protein